MKRISLCACMLAMISTGVLAADASIYGRIDLGLGYAHQDAGTGAKSTDTFSMDSSSATSSRFGIRGTEDLGNNVKIKFVLENGYAPDTGALGTDNTIFDREATLQVLSDYGTISFGRVTILGTDGGSFNVLGNINPFGTGVGNVGNQNTVFAKIDSRYDNTITYRSPKMSGLQFTAEYSMGKNEYENKSGSDRYMGLAATYANGGLEAVALFESVNETTNAETPDAEDMYRITVGGNYAFSFGKIYLAGHYFRNANGLKSEGFGKFTEFAGGIKFDELKGESVIFGTEIPVCNGSLMAGGGYLHAKSDEKVNKFKVDNYFLGVSYMYPLSKSAKLYTAAGYASSEYKYGERKADADAIYWNAGLAYYF